MRSMQPNLKPFWTERRFYLPLLIVAAVNGVVYIALTYQLATKQERLAREHASLSETVATRNRELAELESERERLIRNDETANRFFDEVVRPRNPGLTEAIAELESLAAEAGVVRGQTGYSYEDLDVGLVQVEVTMPLEGDYFNIVRFINGLERSPRFFLVRRIGLRRAREDDSSIGLTCEVAFYLKDGDGEVS